MTHPLRHFAKRHHTVLFVFAGIGAFAVLIALYVAFIVHTGVPSPVVYDSALSVSSPEFLPTFSTLTKSAVLKGGTVQILNNGDEFEPDLLKAINSASTSIDFGTYIMKQGEFNTAVMSALTQAANRGVAVQLLLDGYAGQPSRAQIETLRAAGGTVGVYHPILADPFTFDNRTHRRAIVVDDSIAYIGGIAIQDEWLGNGRSGPDHWRDMMFKLSGAMALSLEQSFNDQWLETTGVLLTVPAQTHDLTEHGADAVENTFVPVVGSSGDKNRPIDAAFIASVAGAQKSIYITNPYFIPDSALRALLEAKAKSGVEVEVLVPGPATDSKFVRWASHVYYGEMLASGIHIYEYQPALIHSKALVIDGTWSLIGSANIDNRSSQLNDENLMGIMDPVFAGQLIDTFHADLPYAKKISREDWSARGVWSRVANWFASLPLKQY